MILPNPEQLLPEMVAALKQYLSDRDIQEPRFIGIRTGGVWVAQAMLGASAERTARHPRRLLLSR
jgi:hypothetical protein